MPISSKSRPEVEREAGSLASRPHVLRIGLLSLFKHRWRFALFDWLSLRRDNPSCLFSVGEESALIRDFGYRNGCRRIWADGEKRMGQAVQ